MRPTLPFASLCISLFLASCTGDGVVGPDGSGIPVSPSYDLLDGSTGGNAGFYFLPPLVNSPTITGTFNPYLLPDVRICELEHFDPGDQGSHACITEDPSTNLPSWGPGEVTVQDDKYVVSWDTDDARWTALDPDQNYRIIVSLSGTEMGHMDVNPQNPSGSTPGEDYPGLYAFRLGETIPIKFWLSEDLFCDPSSPEVLQCAEVGILDQSGGSVALSPYGTDVQTNVLLTVTLPPDALPDGYPTVTMTLERLDNDLVQCLPTLDAPQFGPCFRITTEPELPDGLQAGFEALVAICVDPAALGLTDDQEDLLQIHRYHADENGQQVQALANRQAPECSTIMPSSGFALLPVPDHGVLRYAAKGVNALASLVGPKPLAAAHLGLGGLTSSFSHFRWALPGDMSKVPSGQDPDFLVEWGASSFTVSPTVLVQDAGIPPGYPAPARNAAPVAGAKIHFQQLPGVSDTVPVTGSDGMAATTWTVPGAAGTYTLTAQALGLYSGPIPDHASSVLLAPQTVTFTATVVGAPASMTVEGAPSDGAEVASSGTISATVADENQVTVGNAKVSWTISSPGCDTGSEEVCGTVVDNGDGTWTWTLGQLAGVNRLIGTVDGASGVADTIMVTTTPAPAAQVQIDEITDPVVGKTYTLSGTSQDAYGNDRPGDALSWSVDTGSLTGTSWTLGTVAGEANTVTATVDGSDPAVSGTYTVQPVADVPDIVTAVSGGGQTGGVNEQLANPLVVQVTDQYGNATPSQAVSWSPAPSGSVSSGPPYYWTLGPSPNITYTATASVGGSADATFTANAFCRPTIDGTRGVGEWACAEMASFDANISGGTTKAEVYWMNDDRSLYLMVRVKQPSLDKANNVRFDFDNDGNGKVAVGDDAIDYDADAHAFSDEYLTAKCANSNQAGCGAMDTVSQDGAGAVGNDGTWTVYELSHPLRGTPGEDFIRSAAPNENLLGFYLTLRVGNGAQGNTQWPGFRVFQKITIR